MNEDSARESARRLLIVEDDEGLARLIAVHFRKSGFEADIASDGFEALRLIDKNTYDLMLLDQRMPGMTGLEVLARLRMERPRFPVILLSAYSCEELAVRALQMGATDYMTKEPDVQFCHKLEQKAFQAMSRFAEEDAKWTQVQALRQRVSELGCLYALEKLFDVVEGSPHNALQAAADVINPNHEDGEDRTCVVIRIGKEEYASQGAFASPRMATYDIYARGRAIGLLEIRFPPAAEKPSDELPLSMEEHDLMRSVADRIGHFMDFWQTEQRLRESNAALEEYAYVASHDLQAPLQKIESYVDLLTEDYGPQLDEQAQHYLKVLRSSAQSMRKLVRDVLALSRLDSDGLLLKPHELSAIVLLAKDNLSDILQKRAAVVTIHELPCVMGDETRLLQLFQNLIGNAVKFNDSEEPRVEIGVEESALSWWVYVRDNGIGMKKEDTQRVFLPFKRLHGKGKYEGTGIGLALCRKIMRQHGGAIEVESRPGAGSTFWIEFPKDGEAERAVGGTAQAITME